MRYEYSGYLRSLLHAPDPRLRDSLPCIEFGPAELASWNLADDPRDHEWKNIPSHIERTADGVVLEGHFEDVRRIDNLREDDPSFWVALTSLKWPDGRFPIDTNRFPIVEITYRCRTPKARPAWQWSYPGGVRFDGLQPAREWRRIARLATHFGFPGQIDAVTVRLYSTARSTQSMEIQSVRFRAASAGEYEALRKNEAALQQIGPARPYPLLDEFLPLGVFMKAGTALRTASSMEMSLRDYWRLALEDIARHHHNCIALEEIDQLSNIEWRQLLSLAESFGVRVLAMFDWPMDSFAKRGAGLVERHIRPYAASPSILGWCLDVEPPESSFGGYIEARRLIEKADPNHPVAAIMRDPNAFPLYAPFLAATGFSHFKSHAAWDLGPAVRTHLATGRCRQVWVSAPAFVYATETPEWNTCPEVRLLLNQAFGNGARGWFGFSYHNDPIWTGGSCQRSLTGPFLTFSDQWSELGHRAERFTALAPLLLHAHPGGAPEFALNVVCREHPGAQRPEHVPPIESFYLHGKDYTLLYLLSNDIGEVTTVHLEVPGHFPRHYALYDTTEFVRSREWLPMERKRHLEMFPGQGQIILMAEPRVCDLWRERIARRLIEDDYRQIALDLGLARRYDLHVPEIQALLRRAGAMHPNDEIDHTIAARGMLLDLIYGLPAVTETRSQLIRASALVCACDGALCRLLAVGKADAAHELGLRLLPYTRQMNRLRLELRHGRGAEILPAATACAGDLTRLMNDIRALV